MRRLQTLVVLLGGIAMAGLVAPDSPIPAPGTAGAPHTPLNGTDAQSFLRGRALFDRSFPVADGLGPHFNGDSCRSCHQDPVVGGAGGIDVQVQRPAISDGNGGFISPPETGALAQTHSIVGVPREEIPANVVFVEERNSPTTLGLGLIEQIAEATILANQDANDDDDDDIRGVAHMVAGGVVGRFGWKAQVPDLESFARDALSNELGITVPDNGNSFGDAAADPEILQPAIDDLAFFMRSLDFAPLRPTTAQITEGETRFDSLGCVKCHVPSMDGVLLYSNLLLHNVQPDGFQGVTQGNATSGLYRTAPLRGLRSSAPYWHDGRSETIEAAVRRHDGEALTVRQAFENLTSTQRAAVIAFLLSR